MKKSFKHISLLGAALAASPMLAWAQDTVSSTEKEVVLLLIWAAIAIAVVCLLLVFTVLVMIWQRAAQNATATEGEVVKRDSFWKKFNRSMTAAVPVEREYDIDMGHSYDGIRELDNRLPPWWLYGFYATIGIAVGYMWYYHVSSDWSSRGQYAETMAVAQVEKDTYLEKMALLVDESNVAVLTDDASLAKGKKVYESLCVACHAQDGGGGIGPNFTDNYWIHGGDIQNVFKTVKYGVAEKGMISWQDQLSPVEMHQVSSYVLQFVGTTPANPKDAQGELYEPAKEKETAPKEEGTDETSEPTEDDVALR